MGAAGLAALLPGMSLAAQSSAFHGTDAVNLGRAGTGVAYGRSLEAAALNPALLVTLTDPRSAYVSFGMEMQSAQSTLQSSLNQKLFTSDRSRVLPAMGMGWRLGPSFALGLKLDTPTEKHGLLDSRATSRFYWEGMDLSVQRMELQGAWALSDRLSVGMGLGVARVAYASDVSLRVLVPGDVDAAVSSTNEALGLAEGSVHQSGSKLTGCYSLGFRYAIDPRWTVGGNYSKVLRATMDLSASKNGRTVSMTGTNGYLPYENGMDGAGAWAHYQPTAGSGSVETPGTATLGVRQRFNQAFTWELDLRYIQGASTKLPSQPGVVSDIDGTVVDAPVQAIHFKNALGVSLMGELAFTKRWTGRLGFAMEGATVDESDMDPVVGGAACSTFAIGAGYKVWGGELNFGAQARLTRDADSSKLDAIWSQDGVRNSSTVTRVEGTGYAFSIGFRRAF